MATMYMQENVRGRKARRAAHSTGQVERIAFAGSQADYDEQRVVHYNGQRIYFRPLERTDEPLLRCWINDPGNWPHLLWRPPINEQQELGWIDSIQNSPFDLVFGIVEKATDRLIGNVVLKDICWTDRKAELGICIGFRSAQNRGYGTEAVRLILRYAFEVLNLNRVSLKVHANNPRAIWVYQRCGFVVMSHNRCK